MSHGTSAIDTPARDRDDAAMTTPRRLLVDPDNACDYHLVSRCVQGAFLEVHAYCIMGNHFHPVVRYDPLACRRRSRPVEEAC